MSEFKAEITELRKIRLILENTNHPRIQFREKPGPLGQILEEAPGLWRNDEQILRIERRIERLVKSGL